MLLKTRRRTIFASARKNADDPADDVRKRKALKINMRKKTDRIFSFTLSFLLVLSLIPGSSLSELGNAGIVGALIQRGVDALADERRAEILNSETSIIRSDTFIPGETYTGTAYYFSSSDGKDSNNGRSPKKPIASLYKLTELDLQPGDAVFFKRGDVWRLPGTADPFIHCVEGVTYSAYGEGAKPLFTGSPEDGASSRKWKLYHEGNNGEKIWKFYRDMPDTGGLVVNGGELVLTRAYGWWTGSGYIDVSYEIAEANYFDDFITYGWTLHPGEAQTPEDSLEDLRFCCMIDYTGCDYPIERYDLCRKGPLYLRCDSGNPGKVFDSIEFMTKTLEYPGWFGIINCANGCVIDNLNVSYYADAAIWGTYPDSAENIVVQNCEVGYGGNCIHAFVSDQPTTDFFLSGDGIYGVAANAAVRNNYIHDVDGGAITFETYPGTDNVYSADHYTAEKNLIERCGAGVQLNDGNGRWQFKDIIIADNVILDMDGGWTHNCFCDAASIAVGSWGEINAERVSVTGNVLCGSAMYLLSLWTHSGNILLNGNAYLQKQGCPLICFPGRGWKIIKTAREAETVLTEMGEPAAEIYTLERKEK